MNNHATLPHVLRIGEQKIPVRDLVDASHAYLLERGDNWLPDGEVSIGNNKYKISMSGRVWLGDECIVEPQT